MFTFVYAEERQDRHALTPEELVALADRMVASKDPREADDLELRILSGFYGN